MDRDEMLRVLRAFDREALEYVLIGAAAMGFHGIVRATEDLDVFFRASEDNVERLKRAFRAAYGGDPNIEEISAADLLGDYPAVRYYPPSGDLYFDVMTRLGEAASVETVSQESKGIDGIRMHVATRVRPAGGVVIGVQRFRSIEEMFAAPVIVPPGEGFERFARHCQRYWTIAPRVYPRGVFRFKTIAEAQAARNGSRLTGTRSPCR
jgi:hypothetical protein